MILYHGTHKEAAESILDHGLKRGSYVANSTAEACQYGRVIFKVKIAVVDLDIPWDVDEVMEDWWKWHFIEEPQILDAIENQHKDPWEFVLKQTRGNRGRASLRIAGWAVTTVPVYPWDLRIIETLEDSTYE